MQMLHLLNKEAEAPAHMFLLLLGSTALRWQSLMSLACDPSLPVMRKPLTLIFSLKQDEDTP